MAGSARNLTRVPCRGWRWLAILAGVLSAAPCLRPAPLGADVFVLARGGRIHGQPVQAADPQAADLRIATPEGIQVRLAAADVQRTIAADPRQEAYRQRALVCEDTVAAHWAIAEWCRQQRLHRQRNDHLTRILELEPDHAGARYGLGYSQVRGQWVLQDELQQRRGYQRYEGRWRTEQEIQLLRQARERTAAERNWLTQLRRWRQDLGGATGREAYRQIAAVRDPAAVSGLAELLQDEAYRQAKLLYVQVLAEIASPAAVDVLFAIGLADPDEEVFHACLDALVRRAPPRLAARYVEHLRDNDNVRVNRAAHALGRLDDTSVLSPLIDALVTTHAFILPGRPAGYHATFRNPLSGPGLPGAFPGVPPTGGFAAPLGGSGLAAGNQDRLIAWTASNPEVLQALIQLSGGANFGFDQQAWRFWLASESRRKPPEVRARRD